MSTHNHAVVWIDHKEAKVVFVGLTGSEEVTVHSSHADDHLHHKANEIGSGHSHEDHDFLKEVGETMDAAGEIVVIGPAEEKHALVKYLEKHQPGVARKVVKVEAADHLTDKELVAYAKRHFKLM